MQKGMEARGREEMEAIGRQRCGTSVTVEQWEHKIEDDTVGRLHRLLISSQLVHSDLHRLAALSSIYPALQMYLRSQCDTRLALAVQL